MRSDTAALPDTGIEPKISFSTLLDQAAARSIIFLLPVIRKVQQPNKTTCEYSTQIQYIYF